MIDTHAHLNFDVFKDDIDDVFERAKSEGIESVIVPGVEPFNLNSILDFARSKKEIFCAMGIHPHNAKDTNESDIMFVEKNSNDNKVVAIGEIGLDYYYDFATPDEQKKIFVEQIEIAKNKNLPVIVHNREADDDIYKILRDKQDGNLKGVLHCFSGNVDFLEKAVNLDFHVSFTGNITFKKVNLDDVVKKAPLDRILLETDSPFMTPVPFRGKRNEPSYIKFVANKIAEIKNISMEEVISMTTANAKKLFGIISIILFMMFSSVFLYSQNTDADNPGNEEFVNPFHKFIGIGPIIGYNTIVEEYQTSKVAQNVTYEGLFAYGGSVFYGLLDYCLIDATYIYSKNTKITIDFPTIEPYTFNIFELSSNWIVNPYSRVNFFGTIGYTAIFSTINKEEKDASYINFGLGICLNLDTKYGLINGLLSIKINQLLSTLSTYYPPNSKSPADLTHYFSIPRFGVVFYPKFK
ncbi:MAG: TatD family hydrolase [Ignavibacteriae bacterium]|nr:TatD family hydrolase [Ignavibacteriota bacterium]